MLFPDETYEDYKKRLQISITTSVTSTTARKTITKSTSQTEATIGISDCSTVSLYNKNSSHRKCSKTPEKSSGIESTTSTSNSSSDYKHTNKIFENIPAANKDQIKNDESHKFKLNANPTDQNDATADNEDLSANPIFLRTCEALIQQYRIRPDFFCQYYKAVR